MAPAVFTLPGSRFLQVWTWGAVVGLGLSAAHANPRRQPKRGAWRPAAAGFASGSGSSNAGMHFEGWQCCGTNSAPPPRAMLGLAGRALPCGCSQRECVAWRCAEHRCSPGLDPPAALHCYVRIRP